jgi:hypothetical protein
MRNSITNSKNDLINNQGFKTIIEYGGGTAEVVESNPVLKTLRSEGNDNFAKYIEYLGLAKDPDLLVLSSLHHYYYDAEEMINVKTVINQKELNQIKQLKEFLHSFYQILPHKSNLVGCFVNNRKEGGFTLNTSPGDPYYKRNSDAIENGIASSSPFLNMIYNMIDSKTNKYMSERSVRDLLTEKGFRVLDMTEIDGITYFCAQTYRSAEN